MVLLRGQPLFEKDALVSRRDVEPGKLAIAEFRVELGPLEREGVEPGRMATKGEGAAFSLGQETTPDPGPPRGARREGGADGILDRAPFVA